MQHGLIPIAHYFRRLSPKILNYESLFYSEKWGWAPQKCIVTDSTI